MNLPHSPTAANADHPELDQLVVALDAELASLRLVHFRLSVLRLVLLDGNPSFIQAAAHDLEETARALLEHEPARDRVVATARSVLGMLDGRLIDLAAAAPVSHQAVLHRLASELDVTSRSIAVLRDAVRRLAEDGRRAVLDILDLTDGVQQESTNAGAPGQVFVGDF